MKKNPYELRIQDLLLDVYELGFSRVEWRNLYRWCGAERVTNRIWDDLEDAWKEIDENHEDAGYRLGFLDWDANGFLTLVCLDPENVEEGEESFKPISMKKKDRASVRH